jgi:hypothetical protein
VLQGWGVQRLVKVLLLEQMHARGLLRLAAVFGSELNCTSVVICTSVEAKKGAIAAAFLRNWFRDHICEWYMYSLMNKIWMKCECQLPVQKI